MGIKVKFAVRVAKGEVTEMDGVIQKYLWDPVDETVVAVILGSNGFFYVKDVEQELSGGTEE